MKDLPILVARDPAKHPPVGKKPLAYYRLPGPAGHRSRYEDATLEHAAKTIRETQATELYVILSNVDSYTDAKRLRKMLTL